MKRLRLFERKSLFWKIYAVVLFALIMPILFFSAHRFYDERRRERLGEDDMMEKIHDWSSTLSEQADDLPDDALPAWIEWMERESGTQFYVIRDGVVFRAGNAGPQGGHPVPGGPSVEDLSESGRTRVIVALRAPTPPPPNLRRVRNAGILVVSIGGIILSFLIVRGFMTPVEELRRVTTRLAEGDLSVRVSPEVTRRGAEIGDLARAFNRMAEQVEELVTSQTRLLIDISHEIRSPLQRLSLSLDLARRSPGGNADAYFDRAEQEVERIDGMVEELLTLTRTEPPPVEDDPVDLEEIVRAVADDAGFAGHLQGKTVTVESKPLVVRGDAVLLERAIANIVHNAVRHTPKGTEVRVEVRRDGDFAVLEVTDAGVGVPEGELGRIFLPYYRTDAARGRPKGGTGLGLSITKRLVENYGGSVSASNAPGGGLRVTIRLPLHTAQNIGANFQ